MTPSLHNREGEEASRLGREGEAMPPGLCDQEGEAMPPGLLAYTTERERHTSRLVWPGGRGDASHPHSREEEVTPPGPHDREGEATPPDPSDREGEVTPD